MNFALLNKAKAIKKEESKEFDVVKYLNKTEKLQEYMSLYLLNEPIDLLDSCEKFDNANCFIQADPIISLKQMFGE